MHTHGNFKIARWPFVIRTATTAILLLVGFGFAFTTFFPYIITHTIPIGADWVKVFRPAIFSHTPYAIDGFFSPPWVLMLLSPFSLLPPGVDVAALLIISLFVWIFVMRRLGISRLAVILMLLTPQLWWGIVYANIDFFVPLGLILPPQIGLFFVLSKPQAGIGIAIFWFFDAFLHGGLRHAARIFAPVAIFSVLACIPFGFWPAELFNATAMGWNIASNFPYLVPVGIIMLYQSVKEGKQGLAIASGPFLSPYVGVQSLPVAILGLLTS